MKTTSKRNQSEVLEVQASNQGKLEWAQNDMSEKLKQINDEEVEIQHLGLDMDKSKEGIINILSGDIAVKKVTLKILAITDNENKFECQEIPLAIKKMCANVNSAIMKLISQLSKLDKLYKEKDRQLILKIGRYASIPSIHGFKLSSGKNDSYVHRVTYYSFCRWNEKMSDLSWGEGDYKCILEKPSNDKSEFNLAYFDAEYERLCKISENWRIKTIGGK